MMRPRPHAVTRAAVATVVVATLMLAGAGAVRAQQPGQRQPPAQRTQPPRRQETIEIRGQVPTPQVVTVRPREAPEYSRRVLVPAFFDRDFWPSILPPLQIVAPFGVARVDSATRSAVDSASRVPPATPRPSSGTPPAPPRR